MSSVLTVDVIQKIVKIVILPKLVQIVHGRNVVAGLIYITLEAIFIHIYSMKREQMECILPT